MFGITGVWEWVIILVIIAMFFGVGRLPEVFGSVGKGIREFRKAAAGDEEEEGNSSVDATADASTSTSESR
ncbi:MAG: twin-arginine translocase TatA/TatE family subunit [Chloroflexota bacterium]